MVTSSSVVVQCATQEEWDAFTVGAGEMPPGVTVLSFDPVAFRLEVLVNQDHTPYYVPAE